MCHSRFNIVVIQGKGNRLSIANFLLGTRIHEYEKTSEQIEQLFYSVNIHSILLISMKDQSLKVSVLRLKSHCKLRHSSVDRIFT